MNRKKLSIIIFSVIAGILCVTLTADLLIKSKKNNITRSKVIIPINKTNTDDETLSESFSNNDSNNISLIPLSIDENLISTISIDFNNDNFEDQVIAVKKTNTPNIVVIFGLYNPKKNSYDRISEIQTEITQVKTFNFMTMDLIGNHTNSLIFSGFSENNETIFMAFAAKKGNTSGKVTKIADFKIDGSINIQQIPRNDTYSIYNQDAESFNIIVNTTEEKTTGNGFDQIQTTYGWDQKRATYVERTSSRVSSWRLEATELQRIMDGTTETFTSFLDGLWYKTDKKGNNEQGIFFDPEKQEIIFSTAETQEVYDWIKSSLRRYGISITASNKSISNLVRYIYIDLISSDEIRVRITDDVRMIIGTEASWEGVYKKKSQKSVSAKTTENSAAKKITSILEKDLGRWNWQDATVIFRESAFTYQSENTEIKGSYSPITIHNTDLIQFRADKPELKLNGFFIYKVSGDHLDLIPVKVSTVSCNIEGNVNPIRMEKYKTN